MWRAVTYALVSGVAAVPTYMMNRLVSKHGFEPPEDVTKRMECKWDLAEIERQLSSEHLIPEVETRLMQVEARAIEILASVNSNSIPEASSRLSQLPDTAGSQGQSTASILAINHPFQVGYQAQLDIRL